MLTLAFNCYAECHCANVEKPRLVQTLQLIVRNICNKDKKVFLTLTTGQEPEQRRQSLSGGRFRLLKRFFHFWRGNIFFSSCFITFVCI